MPDYGNGQTNIDLKTGIRYGVISPNDISGDAFERFTPGYPTPDECVCSHCDERQAVPAGTEYGDSVTCETCEEDFEVEMPDAVEPIFYAYERGGYRASASPERDIFVTKSPYYTYGPFCSPCAPGAVSLCPSAGEYDESNGIRAYCFSHEFFDDNKAPYKVFSVATNEEVKP